MAKLTVNLPEEAIRAVEDLARELKITKTEALRRAISNEAFLREAQNNGAALVLEKEGERPKQVVLR